MLDLRVPPTSLVGAWRPLGVAVTDDAAVTGLTLSSADVSPGMVFAALSGANTHGARHVAQALRRGAAAVVTDPAGATIVAREAADVGVPVVVVDDLRAQLGVLSAALYGNPGTQLLSLGVTGTNGKTTTTWLLEAALRAAGHRTGLLGTVGVHFGGREFTTSRTTPEAPELQAVLAYLVAHGADSVALEVSSHALALGRVDGLVLDVAGFTNLGHDHLDFHGDAAAYETAKQRLFTPEHARRAVVVADGAPGARIAARSTVPTARLVSVADAPRPQPDGAVWIASDVTPLPSGGWTCQLSLDGAPVVRLQIGLRGRFNVANAALAAAMLLTVGIDTEAVRAGIAGCAVVPGRMEAVDRGQEFVALVDYAHTPEALAAVLAGVRATTNGRVIAVFGCGGDRDSAKRGPMGAVAAAQADVVVVTDDNPRDEDPSGIRAEILAGARASSGAATLLEVGDRAAAIGTAVALARAGDTLVVAGKGHEAGQQVGDDMLPFDDRSALAAALDAEGESAP